MRIRFLSSLYTRLQDYMKNQQELNHSLNQFQARGKLGAKLLKKTPKNEIEKSKVFEYPP